MRMMDREKDKIQGRKRLPTVSIRLTQLKPEV
jgi:hypothetical protein